jgi:N-acetylglutamate synthase-like GNAT family acetyltransferase
MSEVEISIRSCEDEDFQAISDLIFSIQKVELGVSINQDDQLDLASIKDYYGSGSSGFWVAVANDQIIGTIALLDIKKNAAALQKMFVPILFRGTVSGVANKLLTHFFYEAQMRGFQDIFLGTAANLYAAHRFYEKNGFVRYSKTDLPSRFPIKPLDSRFYHKSI